MWNLNGTQTRTFIGKESDRESNLGDFGARKYDARIGRFTSVDALWEMFPSHSPYHYCYNSPLNYKDPTGLAAEIINNQATGAAADESLAEERSQCSGCKNGESCGMHPLPEKKSGGGGGGGFIGSSGNQYSVGSISIMRGGSLGGESGSGNFGGNILGNPGSGGGGGGLPGSQQPANTGQNQQTGTPTAPQTLEQNQAVNAGLTQRVSMRWGWTANESVLSGMILNPDSKGVYVDRILSPNEFGVNNFQSQINRFVIGWSDPKARQYAPAVASYFRNTSVAVSLVIFKNTTLGGLAGRGTPNIFIGLNTYNGTFEDSFEATLLHETVHAMGGDEFDAFAAEVAAGLTSPETYWQRLINGLSNNAEQYLYMLQGIYDSGFDVKAHFTDGNIVSGSIKNKQAFLSAVYNHGRNILMNGVKK